MSIIEFKGKLSQIGGYTLLRLPEQESGKLPSRGMVMVRGTLNGIPFQAPLEPDGQGSHWFKVNDIMRQNTGPGEEMTVEMELLKDWPEPEVPEDLKEILGADEEAQQLWQDVTTKARWDWLRWIRSTKNPETRKIRIEKTISKLKSGKRNPCCFNRSLCAEPAVSKNGVLLEPTSPPQE